MDINLIKNLSSKNGLDWKIIYAILMCESNTKDNPGSGFWSNGRIKSRFEPHIFDSFIEQKRFNKINKLLPGLDRNWIKIHTDYQLGLMATSFGIAQIMGWHYWKLGYSSIDKMIEDYKVSNDNQILSFFNFIKKYRSGKFYELLISPIGGSNYSKIAKYYNGAGYRKNRYHLKLKTYYENAPNEVKSNNPERLNRIKFEEVEAMPLYTGEGILQKLKNRFS